ncbi:MAG TPA: low temperature requirement protein A [Nocardioides sp.]|nr:low temperature requirement protein A [Nocardioides sp.]
MQQRPPAQDLQDHRAGEGLRHPRVARGGSRLNEEPAEEDETLRVSTLELFFDLVFVFVVTQLSTVLERGRWHGPLYAALELLAVYWMYGGFSWLTNALGGSVWRQRVALAAGMFAFFVVSLAVPGAFGSDAVAFGLAYLGLTVVHTIAFLTLGRSGTFGAMLRIGSTNLAAAGLILAAAYVDGPARWLLWIAAVLLQWLPPLLGFVAGFPVAVAHFAERHGLMVIIVLGESLLSVASAALGEQVTIHLVLGTVGGLLAAFALWWCYFDGEDDAGEAALRDFAPEHRGIRALVGYDLTHVLMLGGVVAIAGGTRVGLPDLAAPAETEAAVLVAAGASAYLLGLVGFRLVLRHASATLRALAAVLVLATIPVGTSAGTSEELAVIAAIIAVMLLAERLVHRSNLDP